MLDDGGWKSTRNALPARRTTPCIHHPTSRFLLHPHGATLTASGSRLSINAPLRGWNASGGVYDVLPDRPE